MKANDIILLGLKQRVTAISKADGRQIWATELSGSMGAGFVTMICDGTLVFAYASGHLHCLNLTTGKLLWRNELHGYGYGLASLCFPNGGSAPDMAAIQQMMEADAANAPVPMPPAT